MKAALTFFLCAPLLLISLPARADLLVVPCDARDQEAATRLLQLHDEPARVLLDAEAREPTHARALGQAHDAARVVVLDGSHVVVVHSANGARFERTSSDESAFAIAFIATELLALAPAPPAPAPPPEPAPVPSKLRAMVRAGVQGLVGPPFPPAFRPELGLGLQYPLRAGLALRGELLAAPVARSNHERVERTSSDVGVRLGAVLVREQLEVAFSAQLGAAWVRARLAEPGLPNTTRTVLRAGLAVEPSYWFTRWFALYLQPSLLLTTPRAEYQLGGSRAAREAPIGFAVSLGVWLAPPFR